MEYIPNIEEPDYKEMELVPKNICPAQCKVCGGQATGYHYEVRKLTLGSFFLLNFIVEPNVRFNFAESELFSQSVWSFGRIKRSHMIMKRHVCLLFCSDCSYNNEIDSIELIFRSRLAMWNVIKVVFEPTLLFDGDFLVIKKLFLKGIIGSVL